MRVNRRVGVIDGGGRWGRALGRCVVVVAIAGAGCHRAAPPVDAPTDVTPQPGPAVETAPVTPAPRRTPSAGWTVARDDNGTVRIRNRHADVIRGQYAFFDAGYRWAPTRVDAGEATGDRTESILDVPSLGLHGRSTLTLAEADGTATATLAWELTTTRDLTHVSGGGLDLTATPNVSLWGGQQPKPNFSSDGRRLAVGTGDDALVFELEGDAAALTPVGGKPGVVRVVLLAGDVPAGTTKVSLRITLPKGGRIGGGAAATHEVPAADWTRGALVHDGWPVDLSFLRDAPAGKHGHVRVVGEDLEFADGTPARFWGTNVTAYALFDTDKAGVARSAKRLAAMGFNLVRLHHHDSAWVKPNVFDGSGRRLRKESLESLDWWIKCLTDEGIYIWLDLHVGRTFGQDDAIPGFAELPKGDGRGLSYVNPRITALMDEFAAAYLERRNIHTGRTIAGDPAIAMVLVTNENDINHHFGSLMDADSGRPVHEALFRTRVEAFAKRAGIRPQDAMRPWEPGASKLALAEIEHAWGAAAIGRLRKLGVRAPVVPTSLWGDEAMYSIPSLMVGDTIDVHSYGGPDSLAANPHFEPNFVAIAGMAAVLGKPHTNSEWNVPPPALDRYIGPTYMAAIAAFQGWDAPMLYAYTQDAGKPRAASRFGAWVDPSLMGLMPAAALLYRRGDVAPAKRRVVIAPTVEQVYGEARNVINSAALRTGVEQSQVVIAMPDAPQLSWDRKPDLARERAAGATIVTDLDLDLLDAGATRVVSDTGELTREFTDGRWTLSTPRSQIASGWIGGTQIELRDGWVALDNAGATFALSSLDGAPIATSKRILVTAVGSSVPVADGRAEFRSAPIRGRFAVRTAEPLQAVPLASTTGSSGGNIEARVGIAGKRDGDLLVFEFDGKVPTHWWILVPR